jgi:hypothetical protein
MLNDILIPPLTVKGPLAAWHGISSGTRTTYHWQWLGATTNAAGMMLIRTGTRGSNPAPRERLPRHANREDIMKEKPILHKAQELVPAVQPRLLPVA